jgi:hypothetical protein
LSLSPTLPSFLSTPPTLPVVISPIRGLFGSAIPGSSGQIVADATIEEHHEDRTDITNHPVEGTNGTAVVTDNAVDLPAEVTLTYGWSAGSPQNSTTGSVTLTSEITEGGTGGDSISGSLSCNPNFLAALYSELLTLKSSHIPFTIYTGKRIYTNMLISTISETTDKETENCLLVRITCREIIVVKTTIVTLPTTAAQVADPSTGLATTNQGRQTATAASLPAPANFPAAVGNSMSKYMYIIPLQR